MTRLITADDLRCLVPEILIEDFSVEGMDLAAGTKYGSFMTFLDQEAYALAALNNPRVRVVLSTAEIVDKMDTPATQIWVRVEDPRWLFFSLQNKLTDERVFSKSEIDSTAQIHPTAVISSVGVKIASGVIVEAGAVVNRGVTLHDDVVIRANAVIGAPGFEHKRTSKGILSVKHDGDVVIGARSEIGSIAIVAEGYARRHTIIGEDCRIDGLSYVAHGVHIADRVFVAAGAVISGMCTIGKDSWIGPSAVIRDQVSVGEGARINIGSVLITDAPDNITMLGNPARQLPASLGR